mmetsp:Transcript_6322/g.8537  ORF Transcript_6322/g.8537 Transcript_6322/m.8537 type:complete len:114 (-) Transcript_6322:47-388(-)
MLSQSCYFYMDDYLSTYVIEYPPSSIVYGFLFCSKKGRSAAGPCLAGVIHDRGKFELISSLMSDFLFKAKVLKKKGTDYMSKSKTTPAVVTADSFLHLFGMLFSAAPEVAFHV